MHNSNVLAGQYFYYNVQVLKWVHFIYKHIDKAIKFFRALGSKFKVSAEHIWSAGRISFILDIMSNLWFSNSVCSTDHWWSTRLAQLVRQALYKSGYAYMLCEALTYFKWSAHQKSFNSTTAAALRLKHPISTFLPLEIMFKVSNKINKRSYFQIKCHTYVRVVKIPVKTFLSVVICGKKNLWLEKKWQ